MEFNLRKVLKNANIIAFFKNIFLYYVYFNKCSNVGVNLTDYEDFK